MANYVCMYVSSSSYLGIPNMFADFFQSTYRQLDYGAYVSSGLSYPYSVGSVSFSNMYSLRSLFMSLSLD